MAERAEGRLARWSRLKAKGGASEAENAEVARVEDLPTDDPPARPAGFEDLPGPAALPGGAQNRNFVPPLAPLADAAGIGDEALAYEAPPPEALAMLNGDATPPPEGAVPVDVLNDELPERELTEEEAEAVRRLPPLESLTETSDFTPFLADNIPGFIRNRALKILWRSDPLFGFQDGLDDYAENFRVIDKLIDAAAESSYRPGKGYDFPEDETEEEAGEAGEEAEFQSADATAAGASPTNDAKAPPERSAGAAENPDPVDGEGDAGETGPPVGGEPDPKPA